MATEKEIITLSASQMAGFKLPRWRDLPDLDIYMDQLISLISKYFRDYPGYEEKSLTSSMVNNYVKQGIIPAPVSKKYNRVHLAALIVIIILKSSIPIARVGEVISEGLGAEESPEVLFDLFCDSFEKTCKSVADAALSRAEKDSSLSRTIAVAAIKSSAEQSLALDLIANKG